MFPRLLIIADYMLSLLISTRCHPNLVRFSLARVSLTRASLARCILTRSQFGVFQFGAFPNFVSKLIQYSMQFFFSAKASSICAHVSFLRMFSAKKCCLSHSTRPTLARVSLSAYFSFLYASYCLRHIFINHLNASSLQHSKLVYRRCFFVSGSYFY